MKVAVIHNTYQLPGGEDECVATEMRLLREHGHEVQYFTVSNNAVDGMNRFQLAAQTVWNPAAYRALSDLFRRETPAIAHFHNTFPLISPAGYYAAKRNGIPVVQTLHNFRLGCPNALFLRSNTPCEKCVNTTTFWPAVLYKCYREDRMATAVTAAMLSTHRAIGTWNRAVDRYIALTEFSREKFIRSGLPAEKIAVKMNSAGTDCGPGRGAGGYAAFVGRLSPAKGILTLLHAWERLDSTLPLKIAGDGPLLPAVQDAALRDKRIEVLGRLDQYQVRDLIGNASVLVHPSSCYENFPRVIAESFSAGTPVIAPRLGAMPEILTEGVTGFLFEPVDASDLARAILTALHEPLTTSEMRLAARQYYEDHLTDDSNYESLFALYTSLIEAEPRKIDGSRID